MDEIKQFSSFKQILDKNSQFLGLSVESLRNNQIVKDVHYKLQS